MSLQDWKSAKSALDSANESAISARTRNELHAARKAIFAAKNELSRVYLRTFNPCDLVTWKHGSQTRRGFVLPLCDPINERVYVSVVTRGRFWIPVARLIDHRPLSQHKMEG
jgi:hypothetical protein